ncbi:MAG: hypothetical protein RLZZ546_700 [Bacteroidota bacterium]|jgi:selenocysteine lyase/cysteine desulfurase
MDIDLIREETRGLDQKLFFNSAGSSLMPIQVVDRMIDYIKEEENIGGYALMKKYLDEIHSFYHHAAQMLNCQAKNIAFTTSATDSYSRALLSIPFEKNDVILTSEDDYISSYIAFNTLHKIYNIQILKIANLLNGDLDLNHFEDQIKKFKPKVVSITHIPTNSGLIQDVNSVGKICDKYDIYYIVDACQSIGQIEVDVQKIKCDFLSATGRKFLRGPRGSGLLYVSDKVLQRNLVPIHLDMRGSIWKSENEFSHTQDATRFEQWEMNYSNLLGLKESILYVNKHDIHAIEMANSLVSKAMREIISKNDKIFLTDKGSKHSNIITWSSDTVSQQKIEEVLKQNEVYYSVALKENAQIDYTKRGLQWSIRFSPHYFNTVEEVNRVGNILSQI